jgi:hypothetical protein
MLEKVSFGLDIATALSIIAAAIAFLINMVRSNRKERKERHKDIVKKHILFVTNEMTDDLVELFTEITKIKHALYDGKTTQNLNPLRDIIGVLPYKFKIKIVPFGKTYGDGRFVKMDLEYAAQMQKAYDKIVMVTTGSSNEAWSFDEIMYEPVRLTETYIEKLLKQSEEYIEKLNVPETTFKKIWNSCFRKTKK